VRGEIDTGVGPERMLGRERLGARDVDPGAAQLPTV